MNPPYGLLAELTHRCPLACLYCSNPLELVERAAELETQTWLRVFQEAAELGVLQLHLSGGEPLLRPDLTQLIAAANSAGLYPHLITSGIGLTSSRATELAGAGLAAVQLSFQATEGEKAKLISGLDANRAKRSAAQMIREAGMALSLNVVLHRLNLDQISEFIELARELGAFRIELANTQYYGWALVNRAQLMPSRQALQEAEAQVRELQKRYAGELEIVWVIPDYYADFPKPCMGGWGQLQLTVSPNGQAYPCPAAPALPIDFPNVREQSLGDIWYHSEAFNAFRGREWLEEPCRSCPRQELDLGGCRCQAYLLTGDPAATDPVCIYSPQHGLIEAARQESPSAPPRYRSQTSRPSGSVN